MDMAKENTSAKVIRAAIYARKSTEDQRNPGKSVADQLREALAEADMRGYRVDEAHVYADDGRSASRHARHKDRPGYAALVAAIDACEVDVIVMAEQSRASRRMSVLGALVELCADKGVRLVIGGRDVDPSDPADLVLLSVQSGMDAAESERTSMRSLRGARSSAAAGKPAGKNMYGYARVYDPATRQLLAVEPVAEESEIVREIVARLLEGDPLNVIADDLNQRGVPSPYDAVAARCGREPRGAVWVGTQVRRVAISPAYAALRVHHGALTPAMWPALITETEYQRVTAIISDPSRRTNGGVRPGAIVHWLSGVAKCGECGHGMRVLTNRGKYRNYFCPECMKVSRAANALEEYVQAHIFAIVSRPDVLTAIAAAADNGGGREALTHMEELTARRDSVRALVVAGTLPPEDGAVMLSALADEIAAADRAFRSLTMPRNVAEVVSADMPDRWESFTPARKREIADALVDVVVLSMHGRKSRSFDPTTVRVTPKGSAK